MYICQFFLWGKRLIFCTFIAIYSTHKFVKLIKSDLYLTSKITMRHVEISSTTDLVHFHFFEFTFTRMYLSLDA